MSTLAQIGSYTQSLPWPALLAFRGALILAAAGLLTLTLGRAPAASRHLVWSLAMTALLLLPALPHLFGAWSLPAPAATPERETAMVRPAADLVPLPALQEPVGVASARAPLAAGRAPAVSDGPDWRVAILGAWLAGVFLLLGRLAVAAARVRRLVRAARPVADESCLAEVAALARRLGIARRVRLLAAPGETMPMTWGIARPVVLLPASAEGWSAERREVVVLHELAHVRRWDCLTQFVAQIACALHWFDPLAWLAARRLLVERERACDDEVLQQGARASEYAAHLVSVARALRSAPSLEPLTAPLARRTRLESRVAGILGSDAASRGAVRRRLAAAAGAALVLILPLATVQPRAEASAARATRPAPLRAALVAPIAPQSAPQPLVPGTSAAPAADPRREAAPARREPAAQAGERAREEEEKEPRQDPASRDRRTQWESALGTFEVASRGSVELTSDESAVTRLEPSGHLLIDHRKGSSVRRLEVTSTNGAPSFAYAVDGQPQPFTGEAQRWLAGILPEIVTETGLGAEGRVERVARERGLQGVFDEVSRIQNPRVRTLFLVELLRQRSLAPAELRQVAEKAAAAIPDGYLPVFLKASADSYLDEPEARAAFLDAAGHISSDVARSQLIVDLLQRPNLGDDAAVELIRTADAHFETDNVRALFLGRIAERALGNATLRPVFMQSFDAIRTDIVLVRSAAALIKERDFVDDDTRLQLFQKAFDHLHTDGARTALLVDVADRFNTPALQPAFQRAVDAVREPLPRRRLEEALQEKSRH
jgi:beta-lactamase regulating signal transducer with metallopeptidase domain